MNFNKIVLYMQLHKLSKRILNFVWDELYETHLDFLSTPPPAYEIPYPAAEGGSISTMAIVSIVVSCLSIIGIILVIVAIVTNFFGKKTSSLINIPLPLRCFKSETDEATNATSELPPAQDLSPPDSIYGSQIQLNIN